jgi:hypothetical protein
MAFKKAEPKQAALKIGFYGAQGSGKTASALLLAEGLAAHMGKRVAYIDTERGTDFYAQAVKERTWHPKAFDFDAIYTRSLADTLEEMRALDTKTHGVLVIDSISHLWQAAMDAYAGKKTSIGSIPMHAWSSIKRPYKEMMTMFVNLPIHCIICGRQANDFDKDEDTGDLTKVGVKMRAEGETPYEPHILVRMYQAKSDGEGFVRGQCVAYFEKDRTGLFTGRSISEPNFATFKPILALLGGEQAVIEGDTAEQDSALIKDAGELEAEKNAASAVLRDGFMTKIQNAADLNGLQLVWGEIFSKTGTRYNFKTKMTQADLDVLQQVKDDKKEVLSSAMFKQ